MAPRGRPALANSHGRDLEKHIRVGNHLPTFVEEFKAKVSNRATIQRRLVESFLKSVLLNYDINLQKIPKSRQGVVLGQYFCKKGEDVSNQESTDGDDVPLTVMTKQRRVKNVMDTPHPSSDDLQSQLSASTRSLRRRSNGSVKSKSRQKPKTANRGKSRKETSVKTVHRVPFSRITANENVTSGCPTTNNLAMTPVVVLENIVTSSEWKVAKMLEKNSTTESSAHRLEVLSNTGRHLVYLDENKPAVVVPNGIKATMVITSETPIETLKVDEVTLRSLEIIHKKLSNVLKVCRQ